MPPLRAFILPGGTPWPRCSTSRARCAAARSAPWWPWRRARTVDPLVLAYLNRLSDLLFVLARHENHARGGARSAPGERCGPEVAARRWPATASSLTPARHRRDRCATA